MRPNLRGRSGFSLLELTISVAILSVMMWVAGTVTDRSKKAFGESSLQQRADNEARRAVDRIATELSYAQTTSLVPNPSNAGGTDTITFRQVVDLVAGVPVAGNQIRIRLEAEPGENANDGIDNDGDGSVDEMRVTLTRDVGLASETTVVLCNGVNRLLEGELAAGADENGNGIVNESGLWISRALEVLTIRLSVQERSRGDRGAVGTVETSVRLRD
jgi:prepilin-type N-terminal cleavage/methylation domain-containing protein